MPCVPFIDFTLRAERFQLTAKGLKIPKLGGKTALNMWPCSGKLNICNMLHNTVLKMNQSK